MVIWWEPCTIKYLLFSTIKVLLLLENIKERNFIERQCSLIIFSKHFIFLLSHLLIVSILLFRYHERWINKITKINNLIKIMKNQWLWFFTQRNKWCNAKGLAPSGVNTVFEQDYATAHWRQNADGTWFSKWKVSTYNCSGIPKNYPYNGGYCLYMGQCYPGPFDNYNAHLYYDRIKCWISYNYNSVNWLNQIIRNKFFK